MISAIILAAGTSSRMGEPKQLKLYKGISFIRNIALNVLASSVDEVIVVSGCRADEVVGEVNDLPVKTIYNPDYAMGQGTSLAAGASQVSAEAEFFLVFMCDQPLLNSSIIDELISEFRQRNCLALRPVHNGQPGHPVILDRSLLYSLKSLTEDEGARKVLSGLGDQVIELEVPYKEVIFDVDTPEAYQKLTHL